VTTWAKCKKILTMPTISPQPASDHSILNTPLATNKASVYYDGGCPLCRAEIATYQQAAGGDTLAWVDAQACGVAELGSGLDRSHALARLHVRRADGTLLQGAAAFAEIWPVLPNWRWLARVARLPVVLPLLDVAYTIFLRIRPLWRPATSRVDKLPLQLQRELRTDHAGETGAVMIYRGVLAVTRNPALREFAQHHLETERRHLVLVEEWVPSRLRSWLLPLWRVSGWLTGALPACFGPRAVYATIQAVETFVDQHYAAQIKLIDDLLQQASDDRKNNEAAAERVNELQSLRELLEQCRLDEVAHRDDAAGRWNGHAGVLLHVWRWIVAQGSEAAVGVCRYV